LTSYTRWVTRSPGTIAVGFSSRSGSASAPVAKNEAAGAEDHRDLLDDHLVDQSEFARRYLNFVCAEQQNGKEPACATDAATPGTPYHKRCI
jgi:hypothetical protein